MILWLYDIEISVAYGHRYLNEKKAKSFLPRCSQDSQGHFHMSCAVPGCLLHTELCSAPMAPSLSKTHEGGTTNAHCSTCEKRNNKQRIYLLSWHDLPRNLPHLRNSCRYLYREIFYTKGLSLPIKHCTECLNIWVGCFRLQLCGWSICLLYSVTSDYSMQCSHTVVLRSLKQDFKLLY